MKLIVDKSQRYAKMRAHTATHLLHAEIAKIIPSTQQAGSFVDNDYLRFDFKTEKLLTNEELLLIEKAVNQHIYEAQIVQVEESNFNDAQKKWAKAFFEDKYGDVVRVVSIHKEGEEAWHSVELCGGTHVANTREIGAFAIISQEAVASGIKRMVAITGPKVAEHLQSQNLYIEDLASKLGVNAKQFAEKLDSTLTEMKKDKEALKTLTEQSIKANIREKYNNSPGNDTFEKIIKIGAALSSINFKEIVNVAKALGSQTLCIYNVEWNYAIISDKGDAKEIAQKLALKGGGPDVFRQGRDINIINFTTEEDSSGPSTDIPYLERIVQEHNERNLFEDDTTYNY